MKENTVITVRGVQTDADGNESVAETVARGEYYEKEGSIYLLYEEYPEGESAPVRNIIKLKGKSLELTKRGAVNARMVFEEGRTHMTSYATPVGRLQLEVETKRVGCAAGESLVQIQAEYVLLSEGEPLNSCKIQICAERNP